MGETPQGYPLDVVDQEWGITWGGFRLGWILRSDFCWPAKITNPNFQYITSLRLSRFFTNVWSGVLYVLGVLIDIYLLKGGGGPWMSLRVVDSSIACSKFSGTNRCIVILVDGQECLYHLGCVNFFV